ncbi:MAG: permease [Sneathiella sp.]|nr:permease [Sneathiella sp.]
MSAKNHKHHRKPDLLLWGSILTILPLYIIQVLDVVAITDLYWLNEFSVTVFDLVNTIWLGVLIGIIMVMLLSKIPREFVMALLGHKCGFSGILRATLGGVLLDLCSHGILMVGAKLYERGASAGQVIAFLVASPWNSFSLTLVLIALIGLQWTLLFIALSLLIAIITGMLFDFLVSRRILPENPNALEMPADFHFSVKQRKDYS